MKTFISTFLAILAAAAIVYLCGAYMWHDAQYKQQTEFYTNETRRVTDDLLFNLSLLNDSHFKRQTVKDLLKKKDQLTPEQRVKLASLRVELGIQP
jgi:hypothetical protein